MSTEDFEEFDEETKTQVRAWKAIRRDIDGTDAYSKAQFNLGDLYLQHNHIEEAIKFFNNIQHMDNPELYAKTRVDLGIIALKNSSVSDAIQEWRKINRADNVEAYVLAQHYISDLLIKKNDLEGALITLKNIRREDDISLYTKAQLNIGDILHRLNDYEGAIRALSNIKQSDTPRSFALAQTNIGNIFHIQGKVQEAIESWTNILPTDDAELYANAQYNIGHEAYENGDIEKAINIWRAIRHTDNPEIYAITNFNIGATLREIGNDEGAIKAWKKVERNDDPDSYAKAKFSIGVMLNIEEKYDEALIEWKKIARDDNTKMYAQAQFNIGNEYKVRGNIEGALLAWSKIKRDDDINTFSMATFNTGMLLNQKGNTEEAIEMWSSIKSTDHAESYAHAQFKLGKIYIDKRDAENAKEYFKASQSYYPYESYCYLRIIRLLEDSITNAIGQKLLSFIDDVLNIVKILMLDFGKYDNEEKPFERKLAHYTGTSTVNKLLDEADNDLPSPFRLNTINNVNDPSEGQLLINKLKGINNKTFKIPKFNEEFHAFISCFTFNHDSLNQFRLYGKQDNKEASGMSLVFKKDFFQSKSLIGGLSFLSMSSSSKKTSELFSKNNQIKSIPIVAKSKEKKNVHHRIGKKPIMRCVYMDPTSEYIHVAQRSRLTFYREFGENTIDIDGKKVSQADHEWKLYKTYIDEVTQDFSIAFSNLKTIFKSLESEIKAVSKTEEKIIKELMIFVDQVLLPLKYLIKHSAFREEEECRMIYITSIDSPEVLMQYGSFLYVEYEPKVKSHLDKVYIAPVATQYHPYLAKLLSGTGAKIELSGNPYRQT